MIVFSKIKRWTAAALCAAVSLTVGAVASYDTLSVKAERFFDAREWASAQALYGLMLDRRPDCDSTYVNAIIASSMLGQPDMASHLLTEAMKAGVSFPRLMSGVKSVAFEVGEPDVYEDFMLRSQRDCPWLERAIDSELLQYYIFRRNGSRTIVYAEKMLAGLPSSIAYLSDLADGYVMIGDFDGATATWKRILDIDADNYLTLLKLGNYYDICGRRDEAIEYLSRADRLRQTPFVTSRINTLVSSRLATPVK